MTARLLALIALLSVVFFARREVAAAMRAFIKDPELREALFWSLKGTALMVIAVVATVVLIQGGAS